MPTHVTKKNTWSLALELLGAVFLVWNVVVYLTVWINSYRLQFTIRDFDDSLRLLASLYVSQGLLPYDDFAFVYPPGYILPNMMMKLGIASQYRLWCALSMILTVFVVLFAYVRTRSYLFTSILVLLSIIAFDVTMFPML